MLLENEGNGGDNPIHLRRGKWSVEEENYANKIISLFNQGKLAILPGTTLRSFLSEKLQCDPMRITKKYAGKSCIGKQIYQPCEGFQENMEGIREAEKELEMFEKIFLNKIQAKAAASAALHSPIHNTRSPSQRLLLKQATSSEDLTVQQTFANIESKSDASDNEEDNRDLDEEEEAEAGEGDKFHVDSLASVPMVLESSSEARRREKHVITREGGRARYPHKRSSFYRRNMSAPNLSTMNAVRLGEKGSVFLEDDSSPSNEPAERSKRVTEEFLLLGGRVPLHQMPNNAFAPSSLITAKKRSHSVMALMDFEKLVNDEKAAGDLFYEFITMMGNINGSNKRQTRQNGREHEESLPNGKLSMRTKSEENLALKYSFRPTTVNVKMEEEEEESSNHSRETVVHRYEEKLGHTTLFHQPVPQHVFLLNSNDNKQETSLPTIHQEENLLVVQHSHQHMSSTMSQDDSTDDCDNFF
eukprot:gene12751-13967_t